MTEHTTGVLGRGTAATGRAEPPSAHVRDVRPPPEPEPKIEEPEEEGLSLRERLARAAAGKRLS